MSGWRLAQIGTRQVRAQQLYSVGVCEPEFAIRKLVGRANGMILSPPPANKPHRKFSKHREILNPELVDNDHGDDGDE